MQITKISIDISIFGYYHWKIETIDWKTWQNTWLCELTPCCHRQCDTIRSDPIRWRQPKQQQDRLHGTKRDKNATTRFTRKMMAGRQRFVMDKLELFPVGNQPDRESGKWNFEWIVYRFFLISIWVSSSSF